MRYLRLLLVTALAAAPVACGGDDAAPSISVTASAAPTSGLTPLDVSFAAELRGADPSGVEWSWDFGDGSALGTEQSPTHTYEAVGSFRATVTAALPSGTIAVDSVDITVGDDDQPSVSASATPTEGFAPLPVELEATAVGGDGTLTYEWDFGDGSPTEAGPRARHTYETGGSYDATVTVFDEDGDTATDTVSIAVGTDETPAVTATADVDTGRAPLAVAFSCSAIGGNAPLRYRWDFGDGSSYEGSETVHTFGVAGTYDATCSVVDDDGSSASDQVRITVGTNNVPVAVASAMFSGSDAPLMVGFSGGAIGGDGVLTFAWSFGDGTTSTEQNPAHTYTAAGTYRAILTVTDEDGDRGTDSLTIVVTTPPTPDLPPTATAAITTGACAIPSMMRFFGTTVVLDASGSSDPEGAVLTYDWTFVSLPPASGAVLNNTGIVNPSFTPDMEGDYVLRVFVDDGTSRVASNTVTVVASGPTTLIAVSGDGESAAAGTRATSPLVARVDNVCGAAVEGVSVSWSGSNATPSPPLTTTDAMGTASTSVDLGTRAGSARVTASATRIDGTAIGTTFSLTVTAGRLARVVMDPTPAGLAGDPMGTTLTFRLADQYNNPLPSESASFRICARGSSVSFDPAVFRRCTDLTTTGGTASTTAYGSSVGWFELFLPASVTTLQLSALVEVFSDGFEAANPRWSVGRDLPSLEEWERGAPSALGPSACATGAGCWGTDLDGDYQPATSSAVRYTWLRYDVDAGSLPAFGVIEALQIRQQEWFETTVTDRSGYSCFPGPDGAVTYVSALSSFLTSRRFEPHRGYDVFSCRPGSGWNSGASSGWVSATYEIAPYVPGPYFWVLARDDAPTTGAGWYIDDVRGLARYVDVAPLRFAAMCDDGVDNDMDGAVDFPFDPGCDSPSDTDETDPPIAPECANGLDDDMDGLTDFPADPDCVAASGSSEATPPCRGFGPFTGSGSNGGSGRTCLQTYTFPAIAGRTYTISTCGSFSGDPYLVVSGACSCFNDDACGVPRLASSCTCTARSSGTVTICASSFATSFASWSYTVTDSLCP